MTGHCPCCGVDYNPTPGHDNTPSRSGVCTRCARHYGWEPTAEPPIWLLDIDGVINASRAGWSRAPHSTQVWSSMDRREYRIRWEPQLIAAIRRIHDSALAVVRWSTTWCPDITAVQDRLGTGAYETAFGDRPAHLVWAELKVRAALDVLEGGRRLIWTDDVEVDAARDLFPELGEAEKAGRALLIAPNPSRGLRPEHIDLIEAFCKEEQ
ncbi:HAD domain-containing protein [Actinoplanes rectilineatus]|uniref:HAD domain-containing protein n=1 Tax=Actinoplanes rectilineatus TaxID=113571 RepID=UPI000697DE86|nr:HAD domain-containing protein [Actinoplanes rectilineatus]